MATAPKGPPLDRIVLRYCAAGAGAGLIVGALRLRVFSVGLDAAQLWSLVINALIGAAIFGMVGYVERLRRRS